MRCVIVVHPYFLAQQDTDETAFLSCGKICIDDSRFNAKLHKDKRVTLNKRHRNQSGHVEFTNQHHRQATKWLVLREDRLAHRTPFGPESDRCVQRVEFQVKRQVV